MNPPLKKSGFKIKEWKILEQVGQGSFGKVFHILDCEEGRPAAMKQLALPEIPIQTDKPTRAYEITLERVKVKLKDLQLELDFLSKLNHVNM